MRFAATALGCLVCVVLLAACAEPAPPPPGDLPRNHLVEITSNGWHSAIVVERAELAATGLVPEIGDFPDAVFLEFGWGDRMYYAARHKTLGMTLDAALIPTPSVMHVAGLARPPDVTYPDNESVTVGLGERGFRRLIGAIADSFARPPGGRAVPVSRGLYADSFFYDGTGSFYLFNTCNTWTARMLRAGGVAVSPSGVITADELMARLRTALLATAPPPSSTCAPSGPCPSRPDAGRLKATILPR